VNSSQLLAGSEATTAALRRGLEQKDVLLAGCPLVLDPDHPMQSRFELAMPDGLAGKITASELARLNVASTLLVSPFIRTDTISAVGERGMSEAFAAVPAAFIYAGGAAVLTSLWPVPQNAAEEFVETFVSQLAAAPNDWAQAFAAARKKQMGSTVGAPPHWAAFVLLGAATGETAVKPKPILAYKPTRTTPTKLPAPARSSPQTPTTTKAMLVVDSVPPKANVFVDGRWRALTPRTLPLTAGTHEVRVALPGYAPWSKNVSLSPGQTSSVVASLGKAAPTPTAPTTQAAATPPKPTPAPPTRPTRPVIPSAGILRLSQQRQRVRIFITSNPGGAQVYINGERMGHTPIEFRLLAGPYRITLRKQGYAPYEQRVILSPNRGATISASLQFIRHGTPR